MLINDLREAERFAANWRCRKCGATRRLTASWNCEGKSWQVVCLNCGATSKADFYRPKSITAQWFEKPQSVAVGIANKLETKHKAEIEAMCEGLPPELAEAVRQKYYSHGGEKGKNSHAGEDGSEIAIGTKPAYTATREGGRGQGHAENDTQAETAESPPGQAERGSYIVSSQEWDW